MPEEPAESRLASTLRQVIPWLTAILVIAGLWTAWVMISRRNEAREAEAETARRQAQYNRDLLDRLGGDRLTVLTFYASPPAIHRGTHVSLCYGVSNATTVVIEPGLGSWRPALSRCIDVAPAHTTSYTLTAKSARGETVTADTKVIVE
ncbi:MAG TPA: hypothetical protein VMJ34_20225 [Bryobacteraceae bacterium]|nr:hypothetical protein [Bryobacteraceae bacterium]